MFGRYPGGLGEDLGRFGEVVQEVCAGSFGEVFGRENSRKENGAFYITKRQIWEEQKCRLGGKIGFYTMKSFQSIEIDTELDWALLEELILKLGINPQKFNQ